MTVVLRTIPAARQWVRAERSAGKTLGLVPTMGALHAGHFSLIRCSRSRCDRTVISIFVNPLQFGPGEDFQRYPRDFERDLAQAEQEGVDAVFHPSPEEMYPEPPRITVSPGKLGESLCGASRPGHFQGVATVLAKLFHILPPDRAFFGQKDAQQAVIIQRMVQELDFPVAVEVCPTVREPDGLALSSRNRYLSPEERSRATVLYRCLKQAESLLHSGVRDAGRMEREMQEMIHSTPGVELDYARIVDRTTLEPVRQIGGPVLAAVAARLGNARLIDNIILTPQREE